MLSVTVVGAGLAGSECAYQLAEAGLQVRLLEQKPVTRSAAHHSPALAELVCSNSLRGAALVNAVGLIKEEMRRLGSLVLAVADRTRVPAGGALAVDRERFSAEITATIDAHPRIERVATVVEALPVERPLVLATGPMTGDALTQAIAALVGKEHLAYYDSIAPIVSAEGIDLDIVFRASRYDKGGDAAYLNCPMDKEQYYAFVAALIAAEKVALHDFEDPRYFEGCLPVEVMAERGVETLSFGPMKPVGLIDPRTGKRAYAVVQLRQEDTDASAYNLVGFQTRMTRPEQQRVFAMIPGLANVRFERYGSVHRNTFLDSPRVLDDDLALLAAPGVYVTGQLGGVEGYVESAASGLMLGLMLGDKLRGRPVSPPPPETALGALRSHLRRPSADFQPSNVVWSMFPPLGHGRRGRRERREAHSVRALEAIERWQAARLGQAGPVLQQAQP